jgi:hypothetical protein
VRTVQSVFVDGGNGNGESVALASNAVGALAAHVEVSPNSVDDELQFFTATGQENAIPATESPSQPSAGVLAEYDGDFVFYDYGVAAQRYDQYGNPIGSLFSLPSTETAAPIATPDGGFLISRAAGEQRVNSDRTLNGSPFQVHSGALTVAPGEVADMAGGSDDFAYVATSTYAYISGTNGSCGTYFDEAVGYSQTNGSSQGTGIAYLEDSTGNDTFVGTSTYATMSGANYTNQAQGFMLVEASSAGGGNDTAWLYDSPGANSFTGSSNLAQLSSSATVLDAQGFANVNAIQSQGTDDTKHVGAIDYVLMFQGTWTAV